MNGPRAVVIVDGFSFRGLLLASRFLRRGISCIGVISSGELPGRYRGDPAGDLPKNSLYRKTIACPGDPGAIVRELAGYTVIGIIPGSGTGIPLADSLSERLNLCTNGTGRSAARHDRFLMQQTLIDAGVPTKEFIRTSDEIDLLAWYRSRRFRGLVLKPVNRASGREILFCNSEEEVLRAFRNLAGTGPENGDGNTDVLAEEYLAGTEYCVDTVSSNGNHRLAGIRKHGKGGPAGSEGDGTREQEASCGDRAEVVRYTLNTLDALRIRYGAASTRIMMTENGPFLIDSVAWTNGGTIPPGQGADPAGGLVADLVVEAYADPEGFMKSPVLPAPRPGSGDTPPD
jgi:hypothetical protein